MKDIEQMLTELIDREGREYTNDPTDRGGPTKYGITQATLSSYRKRQVSADEVRDLEETEARNIYRSMYLVEPGFHRIRDPYVLVLAFDSGVQHGPMRVVKWLQSIAGVATDGQFGDVTEIAVNNIDPVALYHSLVAKRMKFYGRLITDDLSQAKYAAGWMNRLAEFVSKT